MNTNNYGIEKYNNLTFEETLTKSDTLVRKLGNMLVKKGYIVRISDDKNPFYFPAKNSFIRGADIFCAKKGNSYFIDAKDFPKLKYFNATGIEEKVWKKYKYIQFEFGFKFAVIFQDNENEEPYGNFLDNFKLYEKQDIGHKQYLKNGETRMTKNIIWDINSMKKFNDLF